MKILSQRLLIAVFILLISQSAKPQRRSPTFSVQELQQDYEIFVRVLREAHPGLYRYTSKQEFTDLFEKTKLSINREMTEEEFYKLLMPLIVKIRCGHTKWFRKDKTDDPYAFYNTNLFPLQLYFIEEKAYVINDYSGTSNIAPGTEVMAINGKKISQIRNKINQYLPTDGYVQSFLNEQLNHFFSGYFATYVEHGSTYNITLKKGKTIFMKTIPGVSLNMIQKHTQKEKPVSRLPLRFEHVEAGTGLLTIRRFSINQNEQNFYTFIDSVFLDLKNTGTGHLIIDLRNNEGGDENFGGYLYSYLSLEEFQYYKKLTLATNQPFSFTKYAWVHPAYEAERRKLIEKDGEFLWMGQPYLAIKQRQQNAFNGKVYILTNGLSFSVTSEFASMAHHHKLATFIGEETGGAYYGNNSGVFTVVTLPNTQLGMGVPLVGFYTNVSGYPYRDRGVIPDREIKRSVGDLVKGQDTVLDYTLELIQREE
jgi:hypothetical protein